MRKPSDPTPPHRSSPSEKPPLIGRSPDLSDEVFESFLRSVEDFEDAPQTTLSRLLINDGIQLPPPDSFTEENVHDKLWEVINAMAYHRNFIYSTNHLSDLELYRLLWNDTLNSSFEAIPPERTKRAYSIDLISDGSEEATNVWLTYHAHEFEREDWLAQFPDSTLPERAELPHDRDRILPKL